MRLKPQYMFIVAVVAVLVLFFLLGAVFGGARRALRSAHRSGQGQHAGPARIAGGDARSH
jgi:hypothetical protein